MLNPEIPSPDFERYVVLYTTRGQFAAPLDGDSEGFIDADVWHAIRYERPWYGAWVDGASNPGLALRSALRDAQREDAGRKYIAATSFNSTRVVAISIREVID